MLNTRVEERDGIKTNVCKTGRFVATLTRAILIILPSSQTNIVLTSHLDTYII